MNGNIQMIGNAALMERPKVAFLSSRRVAPAAVMRCYDWATAVRDTDKCIMGGFQSALLVGTYLSNRIVRLDKV